VQLAGTKVRHPSAAPGNVGIVPGAEMAGIASAVAE
jgi:hypothetical protein